MTRYFPAAFTIALVLALLMHGPIAQFADYHDFADHSIVAGIPHAGDVLSNLAFAFVAAWGAAKLSPLFRAPAIHAGRYGYGLFILGLLTTACGSTYYHLAPDNARLLWDRLPIALSCAGLLAAMRAKYVPAADERRDALVLGMAAIAGVLWWRHTDLRGHGDLRWYLLFQVLPLVLIPAWQAIYHARRSERIAVAAAALLYGAAKLAELYDHPVQDALHVVSGHTLKHLLAAAAAAVLLWQAAVDLDPAGEFSRRSRVFS